MKRQYIVLGAFIALLALTWGGYRVWCAQNKLVTLDVRKMDVRKVVSKIEWQVWERIIVHNDVKGEVTLNVKRVPLSEVLNIISEQTSSRWSALYPLYTKSSSLVAFKKTVRGDLTPEASGWTNFSMRGSGGWGRGGFGDTVRSQNDVVNLQLDGRDLGFAILALSRVSQARVVPEGGTDGKINLRLNQVPFEKAVAAVAKQVNRDWDQLYTLQPGGDFFGGRGGDFGGPPDFARGDRGDRGRDRGDREGRRDEGTNAVIVTNEVAVADAWRERRETERARQFEAQLATMTPEEQQKAKEEREKFEQMRNLPPEERMKAFQELANSRPDMRRNFDQRMNRYLVNSTPDQRVERAQSRLERQKAREARDTQPNNRR
jgi:hypothetical protein